MADFVALQHFYELMNQQPGTATEGVGHFNIFRVEDMLLPKHRPVTYSRRNFFKVSLVTGHSRIHYAEHDVAIQGTVLVFTNPMIPFFWERISEHHNGYVCIFTEAFFGRSGNIKDYPVFQSAANGVLPLAPETTAQYETLFARMYEELHGDYAYKYDLLRHQLMEIVHGAQKMQPATGTPLAASNASGRITALFAELLERQFPIELSSQVIQLKTPSDFARQLNVHVNHLNKALREVTGQTTSRLIGERLLREAKILLKSTGWSIGDIAWSLGFEEPNHFSGFFKSMAGVTPRQFRQAED